MLIRLQLILQIIILCIYIPAQAQEAPLYSQYFTNPFLYNPAFAGSDGHAALFLTHRRQWSGIEGAPTNYSLSAHTPFSRTMAGGAFIRTESRGILRSSVVTGTIAYVAHFHENHYLRMGLSAGVSHHTANFAEATPAQQPYLANWADQATRLEAAFGLNYHFRNFNLGLALPHLGKQKILGRQAESVFTFSPLDQWVISSSYHSILVPEKLAFEPLLLVQRLGEDKIRMEGGAVFYMNKVIWAGATYRYQYGMTALTGLNIKPGISLGYAYEIATHLVGNLLYSTHELQLKFRLGPDKEYSREVLHKPRFEM